MSRNDFLFGIGAGSGTTYEITCGWCGIVHNEGLDPEETGEGEDMLYVDFGSLTVVECCFDKVEDAVLAFAEPIVDWLGELSKQRQEETNQLSKLAKRGTAAITKPK